MRELRDMQPAGRLLGLAVVALCVFAAAPTAAQEMSAGRYTAVMDGDFTPPSNCLQDVPIGTIGKGKSRTVVTVQITASSLPEGLPGARIFRPKVNGRGMAGANSVDGPDTSQFGLAAVTAVWWLDLDDAESAQPGEFVGAPLEVVIDQLCGAATYHVTAVAQVLRK